MFDFWKLLAGVAIFVLGMYYLEGALRRLSGRKFKLFLRDQTAKPARAIAGGALATALLQSSSVVNMILLALVGAGTIPMRNALAVVLGSNVGTTLTTWIISLVGFKLHIESVALPAIAIAGIARMFAASKPVLRSWLHFLLGFGFLFFGLSMMQESIETSVRDFDFSVLQNLPSLVFLLAGLGITSLIQSSSATIAIALTALHADAISLHAAMAVALGSEIGTTLKLLIASAGQTSSMKRVALGNFLFNLLTACIVFIFLTQAGILITQGLGITDNLIALSFFQTMVNILSIVLFFPMLDVFERFLARRFKKESEESRYISKTPVDEPDLALQALKEEASLLLKMVVQFGTDVFDADGVHQFNSTLPRAFTHNTLQGKYEFIKHLHGDIYTYYIALQHNVSGKKQTQQLSRLIASVRNGMYAAKSFKDAEPDIEQLRNSANEVKYVFFRTAREKASYIFRRTAVLLQSERPQDHFEELVSIYQLIQASYTSTLHDFYQSQEPSRLSEIEISTIINFNREMYMAFKSLLFGVKDSLLTEEDAKYFDDLPGFIR